MRTLLHPTMAQATSVQELNIAVNFSEDVRARDDHDNGDDDDDDDIDSDNDDADIFDN